MFNQLKEYINTKGTKATYEYLPNNYRYSKTLGSTTTKFLWDGDYVAGELDSTGNISKKYFYGLDMLSDDSGNNYVYDIHGSVTDVLNSNGTRTNTYEYNAFGKYESETSAKTSNAWQYCSEYKDNETGLIYLRNRYYDSETGRFINEDPIRSGGNWYSYAEQNPIMFIDPLGLTTMSNADKNSIKNYQNQYNAAKEKNDYVGMNKAHVGAVNIYKKYDANYKDNFDYTHGGKIFNYRYSYNAIFSEKSGGVYILNIDGTAEEREAIAIINL